MGLTSLVVCADEATNQILRRVMENLSIAVEQCKVPNDALSKVENVRFDSIVIDCEDEDQATEILQKVRASHHNDTALAVAIVSKENNVRKLFALGINFVLYKPVSEDRVAGSFRAALSLMQRDRRRSGRVAVHADVALDYANNENVSATLIDLSEEGSALQSNRKLPPDCKVYFQFALPGHTSLVRLSGEVVWQDSGGRVGMKFSNVPTSSRRVLRSWLQANVATVSKAAPQVPRADAPIAKAGQSTPQFGAKGNSGVGRLRSSPGNRREQARHACRLGADVYRMGVAVPNRCSLTDISAGGCYVEMPSPFPSGTRVEIIVRTQNLKLRTQGVVQSVHPGFGMGVQLSLTTSEDREQVQSLIQLLEQSVEELGTSSDPWSR